MACLSFIHHLHVMARYRRGFVYGEARLEARREGKGSLSDRSNDAPSVVESYIFYDLCDLLAST